MARKGVKFEVNGKFTAPDTPCEAGRCSWRADAKKVYIEWGSRQRGDAGLHVVKASEMKPEKGTFLEGKRKHDGDKCHAEFVSKDEIDEEMEEFYLYNILGVDEDATEKQIKKAYHKLSLKYHPDKNPGNEEADTMFKKVAKAYEVLSNPELKILYDMGGMESVKEHAKEEAGGGGGGGGLLGMMFGGGGGGKGRNSKKGPDAKVQVEIELADMYTGKEVNFNINRRVVVSHYPAHRRSVSLCAPSAMNSPADCARFHTRTSHCATQCRGCRKKKDGKCEGCGRCPNEVKMEQVQVQPGMFMQQQKEVKSKEKCKDEDTELKVQVERGVGTGHEITFPMMSEQKPGQIPGDVIVELKQKPHPAFRREANDLHAEFDISLKEALLGFNKILVHLDGHEVTVSESGVTKPGQVKKIAGEGMPVHNFPSDRGKLFVKYRIVMPAKLTEEQKTIIGEVL